MSTIDDLAGKYLDEVRLFVPGSSIATFISGVSLLSHPLQGHESWWGGLLGLQYRNLWYFRDLLNSLYLWQICFLAGLSLVGPFAARLLVKCFASTGKKAILEEISSLHGRAVNAAKNGDFKKSTIKAAKAWRLARERGLWGVFKIASAALSMAAISLLVFALSHSSYDLIPVFIFALIGLFAAFKFSLDYFSTYLPERILTDAKLGLIEPRMLEDLERSSAPSKV